VNKVSKATKAPKATKEKVSKATKAPKATKEKVVKEKKPVVKKPAKKLAK
jgi:hypothetical protein